MTSARRNARPGLALPMTIIAVAGLTLLLIGLLTVLSLERKTARSYSDAARADLAVESGLAVALGSLSEIACRDDSLVFRIEDPLEPQVPASDRPPGFREQFFTYGAVFENGAWRGIPLFSGETESDLGADRINTEDLTSALSAYVADATVIGTTTEHDANIPRAKWVDVPSSDPDGYDMRYAFWIEDLAGRIDGKTAGTIPRGDGLTPAEIDYATILDPAAADPTLPPPLIAARENLRTSASLRTVFDASSTESKRLEPHIHFYNTLPPIPPPKLIPQGFGYADAGQPAPDLNEYVQDKDVDGIAEHIAKQLSAFDTRKGGFPPGEDYLKTLAASLIDYADTDSDATTGPGYRGVDSYPFVNEMYDRYQITGQTDDTTEITVETYIELWNLCQREITGEVEFTNINQMRFSMPPGVTHSFTDFTFPPRNVTIPPNGFRVIYLGEKAYSFPHTTGIPLRLTFTASSQNNFELKWNGALVDKSRRGVERTGGFLDAAPLPNGNNEYTYNWKGNASPTHNLNDGQTGDPRASYYVDFRIRNHSYDKSNWGGRSEKRGTTTPSTYEVRLTDWPDKGNSSISGTKPANDTVRPAPRIGTDSIALDDGTPYPPNQPTMAPALISNVGSYLSLAELGNIFDPAQWEDITDNAAYAPQKNAGGGLSLAIGRPEFPPFDKDGLRAAQLLDIFSIPAAATRRAHRVNLNTAPREVLRSLFGGVVLSADPANPGLAPPLENEIGDIFADRVIATRREFPLRGLSDLNLIATQPLGGTKGELFFGNPAAYPEDKTPPEQWDDAGREELFRKSIGLVTFQSKIFRIVSMAELLDANGRAVSRSAREYHYRLEPARDPATSLIIPGAPVTLTKLYENNL